MANVHGLGSLEGRNNRNPPEPSGISQNNDNVASSMGDLFEDPNSYTPNILVTCEGLKVPFYSGARALKNPRQQNFCDFFLYNMCPVIKIFSFTVAICLIDIAIFIATAVLGLNKSGALLQIQATTLYWFKGVFAIQIYKGEFYRLICAIGLHATFIHIFGNLLVTLIVLSRVQYTYGTLWTIPLYIISGTFGNLFSVTIQQSPYQTVSVGASTALFGVMGLLIGYVIINYSALEFMGRLRCSLLTNLIMMVVFSILISAGVSNVDNWGHFGGLISGIWLASVYPSIKLDKRQKIIRGVFFGLLIVQVMVCLLVFYLGKPSLKIQADKFTSLAPNWNK